MEQHAKNYKVNEVEGYEQFLPSEKHQTMAAIAKKRGGGLAARITTPDNHLERLNHQAKLRNLEMMSGLQLRTKLKMEGGEEEEEAKEARKKERAMRKRARILAVGTRQKRTRVSTPKAGALREPN